MCATLAPLPRLELVRRTTHTHKKKIINIVLVIMLRMFVVNYVEPICSCLARKPVATQHRKSQIRKYDDRFVKRPALHDIAERFCRICSIHFDSKCLLVLTPRTSFGKPPLEFVFFRASQTKSSRFGSRLYQSRDTVGWRFAQLNTFDDCEGKTYKANA